MIGCDALCREVAHFFQGFASLGRAADLSNGPFKPCRGTGSVYSSERGLFRLGLDHGGEHSSVQFLLKFGL